MTSALPATFLDDSRGTHDSGRGRHGQYLGASMSTGVHAYRPGIRAVPAFAGSNVGPSQWTTAQYPTWLTIMDFRPA